jgi:SH3 domain protein
MRTYKIVVSALLFNVLALSPAWAETTFITDKIVVDIFGDKFQRGVALKSLPSGTIVEVVEKDGDFAKVRTQDNVEGWLHAKYLTTDKPAKLSILQLTAKHKKMSEKLAAAEEKLSKLQEVEKEKLAMAKVRLNLKQARGKIAQLEKTVQEKDEALNKTKAALQTSQKKLAEAKPGKTAPTSQERDAAKPEEPRAMPVNNTPVADTVPTSNQVNTAGMFSLDYGVPLKWVLVALLICLLAGTYTGYSWLDARIAKRHGGVRLR